MSINKSKNKISRDFTLMEIFLVIAIVGILAGIIYIITVSTQTKI